MLCIYTSKKKSLLSVRVAHFTRGYRERGDKIYLVKPNYSMYKKTLKSKGVESNDEANKKKTLERKWKVVGV